MYIHVYSTVQCVSAGSGGSARVSAGVEARGGGEREETCSQETGTTATAAILRLSSPPGATCKQGEP